MIRWAVSSIASVETSITGQPSFRWIASACSSSSYTSSRSAYERALPRIWRTRRSRIAASSSGFNVTPTILIVNSIAGVLGVVAAGVLVAAGIQVLRNRRSGRKLHWIFVAIKLPLALLTAVATYFLTEQMMRNVTAAVPGGPGTLPGFTTSMVLFQTLLGLAMALAYPITLTFLLRSRTARDYFASLTE